MGRSGGQEGGRGRRDWRMTQMCRGTLGTWQTKAGRGGGGEGQRESWMTMMGTGGGGGGGAQRIHDGRLSGERKKNAPMDFACGQQLWWLVV